VHLKYNPPPLFLIFLIFLTTIYKFINQKRNQLNWPEKEKAQYDKVQILSLYHYFFTAVINDVLQ